MTATLIVPPALEPVTLAEAKSWLRVDHADEDDLIASQIVAARITVEQMTRMSLITQTWRITLDRWPASGTIAINAAPFQGLASFVAYDANRVATPVPASSYTLDSAPFAARIQLTAPLPPPGLALGGIELQVVSGFGATAASVPAALRQAIKVLVATSYEKRAACAEDSQARVASTVAPFRKMRLS